MNKSTKIVAPINLSNSFKKLAKFFRPLLVEFIRYLPISSEIIGTTKGFYESTEEWFLQSNSKDNNQKNIFNIHPSHQIYRSEPNTIEKEIHWKFKIESQRESPKTFVAEIEGGRVWDSNGTVIASDNKFIADLSIEFGRTAQDHTILDQWYLSPLHYINGTVAVLSAAGGEGYFHWMLDVIPRIHLMNCAGINIASIDKFIVNNYHFSYQKETLKCLGIPEKKVIESNKYRHIKAKNLIVPSLPGNTGNVPKWVCDFLREKFLRIEGSDKLDKQELIYINRAYANHRRIINQPDLINFLNTLGFKEVVLESMSVAEQAQIFASAKFIVAPHGSGLSNLVFSGAGTKVIELFSPNYVNVCFWALSNQVNVDYYYVIGEGEKPPKYTDPSAVNEDILVNINSLARVMEMAGF